MNRALALCLALSTACSQAQPFDTDSGTETETATVDPCPVLDHVVINEVISVNDLGDADELGERDDWLELFNPLQSAVDLGGWALTDGSATPWRLPLGTTLPAGGFLRVWCDDATPAEGLHADFKLASAGETLQLLDAEDALVDEVQTADQVADVSWGRVPDGSLCLQELDPPTGGATNGR